MKSGLPEYEKVLGEQKWTPQADGMLLGDQVQWSKLYHWAAAHQKLGPAGPGTIGPSFSGPPWNGPLNRWNSSVLSGQLLAQATTFDCSPRQTVSIGCNRGKASLTRTLSALWIIRLRTIRLTPQPLADRLTSLSVYEETVRLEVNQGHLEVDQLEKDWQVSCLRSSARGMNLEHDL